MTRWQVEGRGTRSGRMGQRRAGKGNDPSSPPGPHTDAQPWQTANVCSAECRKRHSTTGLPTKGAPDPFKSPTYRGEPASEKRGSSPPNPSSYHGPKPPSPSRKGMDFHDESVEQGRQNDERLVPPATTTIWWKRIPTTICL